MKSTMFARVVLCVLALFLFAGVVTAGFTTTAPSTSTSTEYKEGYLLVRFTEQGTTAAANSTRQAVLNAVGGGSIVKMYSSIPGLALVKLPTGANTLTSQAKFRTTAGVAYAEPDYIGKFAGVPNDTRFGELWGMNNTGQNGGTADADIDAPEAWNLTTGGTEVIVSICDSGLDYTHPDLAANVWVNLAEENGRAGVDDDNNGYIDDIHGYDFASGDAEPDDNVGHGTHVAGTVGAVGNNGKGVAGVNWSVRLMACKIGDVNGILISDVIEGIQYSIDMGAKVMNHSWGGYGFSQALYDAIVNSQAAGLLFVAAAGNEYNDNDTFPAYPASYDIDNIISVLATNSLDQKADFSNWGQITVDIGAPGVDILSTVPGGSYEAWDGTSMASPHVAGAVALVWSSAPTLTAAEIKQALLSTVDKKSSLNGLSATGGRLNLVNALQVVMLDQLPPSPDPMTWEVEPIAVGTRTIYMEATTATDRSGGVEYFFDCSVDAFDSGWQTSPIYYRGEYTLNGTYQFSVKARDAKSNVGQSSDVITVVMPSTLPLPYSDSTRWKADPRKISQNRIGMEALKGYGEATKVSDQWVSNAIEYRFICTKSTDINYSAAALTRNWSTSTVYSPQVSTITAPGAQYDFQVQLRQAANPSLATDVTGTDRTVFMTPPSIVRIVGSAMYPTIQKAIDASNHGDVVVIPQGIYRETNINFKGLAITVRSENPENPAIVAATIIDCEDIWDNLPPHETRRAFYFINSETRHSVLAGITIKNATTIDDPQTRLYYLSAVGDPDQGNRYTGAEWIVDGSNALGGAILIGVPDPNTPIPASPTIRNCVFMNCSASGQYGRNGENGHAVQVNTPGGHADRGGNGGNAYGGAIYAVQGSAPLIKQTQFQNCQAVGGDGGNGGVGGDGGTHSDDVKNANGYRGGDGGDAGFGGCAWGGAIYFEPNCLPELYDVSVKDCLVQVGQPGHGGNGGNGSIAKGLGNGGDGGNGGAGGDLRAPNSYAGAVFYGDNANVVIDGCIFDNCKVVAELTGNYYGGDGGNGGNYAGDGTVGGNGGHGGPAYFVPDKMHDIGGATATGGTGGDGGGDGTRQGAGGNGGFRFGGPGAGSPGGRDWTLIPQHTGIWPSNMYYMAYYWEDADRPHIDNPVPASDPNANEDPNWAWTMEFIQVDPNDLKDPNAANYLMAKFSVVKIFYSDYSPFYGFTTYDVNVVPTVLGDPADPNTLVGDYKHPKSKTPVKTGEIPLTPVVFNQPNTGACAGANYYGENSNITMKDTIVSRNTSFANHGGGELYDKGSHATFDKCSFENNTTLCEVTDHSDPNQDLYTDYKFEGFGGGIFADQPEDLIFHDCEFTSNNSYSGGAIYCNFGPSSANYAPILDLTSCTFTGNKADFHPVYSYGGAVYAGNSFDAYEELYFNDFWSVSQFQSSQYTDHGYISFYYPVPTTLWANELEADHILWGMTSPLYSVFVTNSIFEDNLTLAGAGLCLDAANVTIDGSQFSGNTAQMGSGGFLYASNIIVLDSLFDKNIGSGIESQAYPDEQSSSGGYCSGAGLYLGNSDIWLNNNQFTANQTAGYGAALYMNGAPLVTYPQQLVNNLFVQNEADIAGGAVVAEGGSDVDVMNCTFVDNEVTDPSFGYAGAILAHDTFVNVTNTIFWGNQAVLGSQIGIGDPDEYGQSYDPEYIPYSTVFIDYSDIQNGQAGTYVSDGGWPWLWYGSNNITKDPNFASTTDSNEAKDLTYYLSQIAAGQLVNSPCLNAGYGNVSVLNTMIGFDGTTRTDQVADAGVVDMGYHYDATAALAKQYILKLVVDRGGDQTRIRADVTGLNPKTFYSPDSNSVPAGKVVSLQALLGSGYTVKAWKGTDNDALTGLTNSVTMNASKTVTLECDTTTPSLRVFIRDENGTIMNNGTILINGVKTPVGAMTQWPKGMVVNLQVIPENASNTVRWLGTDDDALLTTTNTVTMTESKDVYVTFYTPTIFNVTGDYTELQYAIYAAEDGDIVILHPGTYDPVQPIHFIIDKNIVIQGYNPDDPAIVASTIVRSEFDFSGTQRNAVLNGITIQDMHWYGGDGCPGKNTSCGNDMDDGSNGGSSIGGGMRFYDDASATIKNCRIINCSVTGGNGGDGSQDGDGGWGAYARGGAVAIGSGNPRFINCQFIGNYARGGDGGDAGDGGAAGRGGSWDEELNQWPDWDWEPVGGYLPYWKYSGYGGAVYCDEGSKPEFVSCLFKENVVYGGQTGEGDRMYPFGHYKIDRFGGAVYVAKNSEAVFTACTFEDNRADANSPADAIEEDPYFAYGGTIAFEDDAVVTLKDCVIKGGQAHHGGAIYSEYATLNVSDCNFAENIATFGGALYYVGTDAVIDKSTFIDNDANVAGISQGGAIFTFDSNTVVTDAAFYSNNSGQSGGAMFLTDGQTTVKNALIVKNTSVRDGAGISANWYADVDIQSSTFAHNEVLGTSAGVSKGGAIYAGYQTYMDIINSILWGNSAGQGQQLSIGSGFEFDPVPSTVTISYSDVQGGRGFTAVSVEEGCTLNWNDADMLYADPLFVSAQTNKYYLSQPSVGDPTANTSPCIDKGSDLASTIGLDKYTTTYPIPRFDFGIVDMGFHYPFEQKSNNCAYADLAYKAMGYQLDGLVGLNDLVILASYWLSDSCSQANRWCHGSDLNFYSGVDFDDFVFMSSCWETTDIQSPLPNPAQWATAPMPDPNVTTSIYMEAVQATDNWIGGVEYYFENQTDPSQSSGWRQGFDSERPGYVVKPWIFIDAGLQADKAYTYVVRVRDVAENVTADSQPASAIPGVDVNPPSPDPSQWAVQPYQTGSTSLRMQAVQAVDAEGNGVEYLFVCVENNAFSSGWRQNVASGSAGYMTTPWLYDVNGLTLGQTYTFYVKTRDRSLSQNETDPSSSVATTMAEIDAAPPMPDPAVITSVTAPYNYGGVWYQIVTATVAEDDSGVEYKFTSTDGAPITGNNALWRYDVNVNAPTPRPAGAVNCSTLVDPTGATQTARIIWVPVGSQFARYTYRVQYRDQSPAANTGQTSAATQAP